MADHKPPSAPRIAISFGKNSSSSSSSKPSRPPPPPPPPSRLGKRSRAPALGNDSDSDSDDGRAHRHEAITELGGDSDADRSSRKKPRDLVITKQSNRDWKAELRAKRGGKNLLPAEAQAAQAGAGKETEPADAQKDIKWGLTVTKPRQQQVEDDEQGARTSDGGRNDGRERRRSASPAAEAVKPQTADEAALDALLGKKRASEERTIRPSEDSAYKDDVAQHVGADATMEDYDAIPDGEFGAALLRGMGWDGKMRGPKPSRAAAGERRQNQLGLGAKKLQDAEDLGQWNHGGAKKRDGRPPKLADYRRGEERKKAERRDRREGGYRERDRYEDAARDRERDRDRGRDSDYDRDRGSHRERDRERDSGRHRSEDGHSSMLSNANVASSRGHIIRCCRVSALSMSQGPKHRQPDSNLTENRGLWLGCYYYYQTSIHPNQPYGLSGTNEETWASLLTDFPRTPAKVKTSTGQVEHRLSFLIFRHSIPRCDTQAIEIPSQLREVGSHQANSEPPSTFQHNMASWPFHRL